MLWQGADRASALVLGHTDLMRSCWGLHTMALLLHIPLQLLLHTISKKAAVLKCTPHRALTSQWKETRMHRLAHSVTGCYVCVCMCACVCTYACVGHEGGHCPVCVSACACVLVMCVCTDLRVYDAWIGHVCPLTSGSVMHVLVICVH